MTHRAENLPAAPPRRPWLPTACSVPVSYTHLDVYKRQASIDEPMAFILSADYLASPESPLLSGRSELEESRQREVNYVMPDADVLARHHFALMDDALMHQLLPCYGGNPLAFFKAFLGDEIPEIKQAIRDQLELLPQDIELILSWSNCPSLEAVAAERGIPVAYLEVGPLREPQYRSTAYFDFSGVNGNTEAEARYQTGNGLQDADFNLAELRRCLLYTSYAELVNT